MEIKEILEKLKTMRKIENDKELAEILNVKYFTLRGWIQRNTIPFEVLIDFCQKNDIDLNYIFGIKGTNMLESPATIALKEAVAVTTEREVANHLKEFTLQQLILKLFPKKQDFFEKLGDIVFPVSQRMTTILFNILKNISIENEGDLVNAKEYLIGKVKNLKLLSFENFGITPWDQQKLISIVENLTEEEAKFIIKDASKAAEMLREHFDYLNKIFVH